MLCPVHSVIHLGLSRKVSELKRNNQSGNNKFLLVLLNCYSKKESPVESIWANRHEKLLWKKNSSTLMDLLATTNGKTTNEISRVFFVNKSKNSPGAAVVVAATKIANTKFVEKFMMGEKKMSSRYNRLTRRLSEKPRERKI